jgi:hypothetical protein
LSFIQRESIDKKNSHQELSFLLSTLGGATVAGGAALTLDVTAAGGGETFCAVASAVITAADGAALTLDVVGAGGGETFCAVASAVITAADGAALTLDVVGAGGGEAFCAVALVAAAAGGAALAFDVRPAGEASVDSTLRFVRFTSSLVAGFKFEVSC